MSSKVVSVVVPTGTLVALLEVEVARYTVYEVAPEEAAQDIRTLSA
jgi:hypothetical protein